MVLDQEAIMCTLEDFIDAQLADGVQDASWLVNQLIQS
jgi:hypothetical protein